MSDITHEPNARRGRSRKDVNATSGSKGTSVVKARSGSGRRKVQQPRLRAKRQMTKKRRITRW